MPKTFLQSFLMDSAKSFAAVLRPALVLLLAFLILGSVVLAYQAIRTLQQLNAVEAERDRWQRADDIIQQLDLKPGTTVVDFGSGAGYSPWSSVSQGAASRTHNRILTVSLCALYGFSSSISPTIVARFPVTTACR